jgi:hypothetical protein
VVKRQKRNLLASKPPILTEVFGWMWSARGPQSFMTAAVRRCCSKTWRECGIDVAQMLKYFHVITGNLSIGDRGATRPTTARPTTANSFFPSISNYHPPVDITGVLPWWNNPGQSAFSILMHSKAVGSFHRSESGCNLGVFFQMAEMI